MALATNARPTIQKELIARLTTEPSALDPRRVINLMRLYSQSAQDSYDQFLQWGAARCSEVFPQLSPSDRLAVLRAVSQHEVFPTSNFVQFIVDDVVAHADTYTANELCAVLYSLAQLRFRHEGVFAAAMHRIVSSTRLAPNALGHLLFAHGRMRIAPIEPLWEVYRDMAQNAIHISQPESICRLLYGAAMLDRLDPDMVRPLFRRANSMVQESVMAQAYQIGRVAYVSTQPHGVVIFMMVCMRTNNITVSVRC